MLLPEIILKNYQIAKKHNIFTERFQNISYISTYLEVEVKLLANSCPKLAKGVQSSTNKVLFTDRYTWQNFCLRLLRLLNNCVESIYNTQKSKTKVLPCVTVGE